MPPHVTNVTITNPLVLYRSLLATNRIQPDPAQHRLALHLQKLYDRLIDYEPSVDYSQRLRQISRVVSHDVPTSEPRTLGTKGIWTSLLASKEKRDSLALTRLLTNHDAAIHLQSPQGLMLHGEVGTGKSMLIDLFADCLPNRKKRRCHFNTFMLDTTSRLEQLRKSKLIGGSRSMQDEYSLLWLARDLIQKSPILFLDEFQLPDRAASKILSNLMTNFFQLGGVLIATSNRMPEELAKAAGIDFARPVSRVSRLGWTLGLGGVIGKDDGPGQLGEFAKFLEVLRARCEVWEMEGKEDYRRLSGKEDGFKTGSAIGLPSQSTSETTSKIQIAPLPTPDTVLESQPPTTDSTPTALPKHYFIDPTLSTFTSALSTATSATYPIPWTPTTLTVYGRLISIPATYSGMAFFTFSQICGALLGPADYITLASTFHTFIITEIPVLTFHQKNEARRFITLLDALYEARCRLMVSAAAGVDEIFFPEPQKGSAGQEEARELVWGDATHAETYSEIHQDLTSPFRPNISSYSLPQHASLCLPHDALEDDPPNRVRRAGSSFTDERAGVNTKKLDFANIRGLTGEDEVFAVKRAQSRVWELCSGKWWARDIEQQWRPLPLEARHWQRDLGATHASPSTPVSVSVNAMPYKPDVHMLPDSAIDTEFQSTHETVRDRLPAGSSTAKDLFLHEAASPFRIVDDAPPKISWTHIWGTINWGKGAGAWGKGVEGLAERKKVVDQEGDVTSNTRGKGGK